MSSATRSSKSPSPSAEAGGTASSNPGNLWHGRVRLVLEKCHSDKSPTTRALLCVKASGPLQPTRALLQFSIGATALSRG